MGRPEQIKERAQRNAARAQMGLKVGDPREVDHKRPISQGGTNSSRNLQAVSQATNLLFNLSSLVQVTDENLALLKIYADNSSDLDNLIIVSGRILSMKDGTSPEGFFLGADSVRLPSLS
jgi:hypothetical protein